MKLPLTVLIPCKNERMNIRSCIESCYGIADEILVADSGSTDETIEIAREFDKVRIIEREYITSGDFKNWAIPQATHEWVLIIDADERVTRELANEILLELSRGPAYDGYWIYRTNYFMGHALQFGDARTDSVLRLFRRDFGRYSGPSDHGEIQIETRRVGKLKHRFLHFSAWNYDQLFTKIHRYSTLQAKQWQEQGKDTTYFKLLVRPMLRFIREYILQGAILDGRKGVQTAWIAAMYSFTKQARLWELNHALPQPNPESRDEQRHDPTGDMSSRAA
ncbi:MAG: glycosyltransferase family 2 protein [Mariniblastus sp.]|nr:glycosyltransferase family 2 protein [Mariniblastus sp.]